MACAAPRAFAEAEAPARAKASAPRTAASKPSSPPPASSVAATTYPGELDDQQLRAWLKKETDIPPLSVVAISRISVIAIMQSQPVTSPQGYEVTVRAEVLDPAFALEERLLSWHATIKLGCAERTVLVGAATGYTQRNLLGEGRAIEVSGQGGWKPVQEGTVQGQIWSARCDKAFAPPLADIADTTAGPISTAPRVAVEGASAPAPAKLPPPQTSAQPTAQALTPPPTPSRTSPPAPQPAPPRATQARPAPLPAPELRLTPQPAGEAPAHPAPAPAARPAVSVSVQVLASPIAAEAQHALAALRTKAPDALAGLHTEVVAIETGSGVNHRAIVSGFKAPGDATRFCQKLTAAGGKCFVRRDGGLGPGERAPAR